MAPPALVNLDAFSDVQFRDVVHRNQSLVQPSANIISKLYTHVSGTTANVSAADVVSIDGSGQGQWDLLLSGTAQRLNANTITTNNTAAWSANSMISVRQASTTIRSANVVLNNAFMGNLTVSTGGRTQLDSLVMQSFSKTLPITAPAFLGICEITSDDGFVAELEIVQGATGIAKSYKFAVSGATLSSTYARLIPLMTAGNSDVSVSIRHVKGSSISTTQLRLHRVTSGVAGNIECTVKVYQSRDSLITILENTDNGLTAAPTDLFGENSLITQRNGEVGIGTDAPTRPLDVVGAINTSGVYQIGGTQVLSGSALGAGITSSSLLSVGTLNGLTVGGSGIAGTLTTPAQTAITSVGTLNGLTVGGSGITGTLLTPAQTAITSVGTLGSLAVTGNLSAGNITVTGDIVFDTPTFKIDSAQNRVGILNAAPAHALDVSGNTNVSLGNGYRINGVQVLSGSALGAGITSSSLTSVATLNGLTVSGSGIAGTLTTAAQTNITSVGTLNGLTVGAPGITGTLQTASQPNITGVGQLTSLGVTGNLSAGNITVTGDIVFDTPTFKLDSVQNRVGILNAAPGHTLDVNGNTNVSAGNVYRIGGTQVLSAGALGAGVVASSLTSVGILNGLTVGTPGITGTLLTASQPNITSIGVLENLALSGNLNLAAAKEYRIDGTRVLSGSALGSGVTTSSLTTVGVLQSLEVTGTTFLRGNTQVGESLTDPDFFQALGTNHILDCEKYLSANVVIDGSVNFSGALVGNVNCGGSFTLEVTLNQFENGNNTVSKAYTIPVQKGISYGAGWFRALPTTATAIGSTLAMNDIDLDIQSAGGNDIRLAIVRSLATVSVNTGASICVSMKVRYNKFVSSAVFTREIGAYTGFEPTSSTIARNTLMTSCAADGVGIFCEPKNSPYWFDVDSPTATGASNFRTSLNLDTVKTGNCFLSFGNAWRFFYNNTTQNLEIHQNSNPSDTLWTSFTMTGILAAK